MASRCVSWQISRCIISEQAKDFPPITLANSPIWWNQNCSRTLTRRLRRRSWRSCRKEPAATCTGWTIASLPRADFSRKQYSEGLAWIALRSVQSIEYRNSVKLDSAQTRLKLSRRLPSAERLTWARELNLARGERRPERLARSLCRTSSLAA